MTGSGTHWVAVGSAGRVRVSENDGQSWHNAASQPSTASPLTEVATDGNGTWMAASNSGSIGQLFRSTDNGEHWTTVTGISGTSLVRTVAWDPATNSWLAAGSLGKVWQSATGAQGTWGSPVAFLHDSGPAGDDLISITASSTGTILVAAGGFGRVYRSTSPAAAYTSSGAQISWSAVPLRVRFGPNQQVMLVGLNNQNWYSKNDGVTWSKLTSGMPTARTWGDVASCAIGGQ